MSVEHDEDFLLSVAVDAAHGDVDVVVAVDDAHAGDVGGQHLLQVACAGVTDHLFGDERGGHGNLAECLCHARCGGDGGCASRLDALNHVDEALWVAGCRAVVRVFVEQLLGIVFRLLVVVESQRAEHEHAVGAETEVDGEVLQVAFQRCLCILDASDAVVLFGILVDVTVLLAGGLGTGLGTGRHGHGSHANEN